VFDPLNVCNPGKIFPENIPATEQVKPEGIAPEDAVTRTVFPENSDQVSMMLRMCNSSGLAVLPVGSMSKVHMTDTPVQDSIVLSLTKMNKVVEYLRDDMVISVEAGMKITDLESLLRKGKCFLPIDVHHSTTGTVGGVVACNPDSIRRLLYGSMRDVVIGMKVVLPDGRIIRAGGKVVKNVAGYDLCKLFTGSMGSLGVITEVTFRLTPLAESETVACLSFDNIENVREIQGKLLSSPLLLSFIHVLNSVAVESVCKDSTLQLAKGKFVLLAGTQGSNSVISRVINEVRKVAHGMYAEFETFGSETCKRIIDMLCLIPTPQFHQGEVLISRVSLPISMTCGLISEITNKNETLQKKCSILCDAGCGIAYLIEPVLAGTKTAELQNSNVTTIGIMKIMPGLGGNIRLMAAPPVITRWVHQQSVNRSSDGEIISGKIKSILDPNNIMCAHLV
jgi:FAD/FMN-containing dehydrogenase